jgi:hypothetical protein
MPYYPTIDEDLTRAKAILAHGKEEIPVSMGDILVSEVVMIVGADNYAAYKLLESFVEHIEHLRTQIQAYDTYVEELETFKRHAITLNKKADEKIQSLELALELRDGDEEP